MKATLQAKQIGLLQFSLASAALQLSVTLCAIAEIGPNIFSNGDFKWKTLFKTYW